MAYRIEGLTTEPWQHLFGLPDEELIEHDARRVVCDAKPGFPCRVSLEEASLGDNLLLVRHSVAREQSPYHFMYAIFVKEADALPAVYIDETPPVFATRIMSMRGFGSDGLVKITKLVQPDEADPAIRELFERPEVEYIDVHNALPGCFAARVERD